eukprot:UN29805
MHPQKYSDCSRIRYVFWFISRTRNYTSHEFCVPANAIPQIGAMCGYDWFENGEVYREADNIYTSDLIKEKVLEILDEKEPDSCDSKPIFMSINFQSIHGPILASPPPKLYDECNSIEHEPRRFYCHKMKYLDETIRDIVAYMKRTNIWDNSIILMSTDNGGHPAGVEAEEADGAGLNIPFRGAKGTVFEGGVHGLAWVTGGLVDESLRGTTNGDIFHAIDAAAGFWVILEPIFQMKFLGMQ